MNGTNQELILLEIARERERQTDKHGDQSHLPFGTGQQRNTLCDLTTYGDIPDNQRLARYARLRTKDASQNEGGDGSITMEHILTEEWAEVLEEDDHGRLRDELIQVAAVAVQWIEHIDASADRQRRAILKQIFREAPLLGEAPLDEVEGS